MPRVDETAKSALRASGDGSHRDREFGRWAVTRPSNVSIDRIDVKPRAQATATMVHRVLD